MLKLQCWRNVQTMFSFCWFYILCWKNTKRVLKTISNQQWKIDCASWEGSFTKKKKEKKIIEISMLFQLFFNVCTLKICWNSIEILIELNRHTNSIDFSIILYRASKKHQKVVEKQCQFNIKSMSKSWLRLLVAGREVPKSKILNSAVCVLCGGVSAED